MAYQDTVWGRFPLGRENSSEWQLEKKRKRTFRVIEKDAHWVAVEVMFVAEGRGMNNDILEAQKVIAVRHTEQAAEAACQ